MHIPHIALDHNTTGFVKGKYNNIKKDMDYGFEESIAYLKRINDEFN